MFVRAHMPTHSSQPDGPQWFDEIRSDKSSLFAAASSHMANSEDVEEQSYAKCNAVLPNADKRVYLPEVVPTKSSHKSCSEWLGSDGRRIQALGGVNISSGREGSEAKEERPCNSLGLPLRQCFL